MASEGTIKKRQGFGRVYLMEALPAVSGRLQEGAFGLLGMAFGCLKDDEPLRSSGEWLAR